MQRTHGSEVLFAAGLEKLLVLLPETNVLQRWDLARGEREVATTIDVTGTAKRIAMGSASAGPLLIDTTFYELDLQYQQYQ